MRAITVIPGTSGSARLDEVPEPPAEDGEVLVQTIAVGVCGTDIEILSGAYGWPPPGRDRLILGHESLGRVLEAPDGCGLSRGDLAAGIVRRPDPEPCDNCAAGEWDMCRNGRYTERGIKQRDGFASERFRIRAEHAVRVDARLGLPGVLMEPASVVAKAWEHVERIGARARWTPRRVLVTGAGPIGLLAALLATQRQFEVHVLDRATEGPKPQLVRDLGARYHAGTVAEAGNRPDIVIECTGVASLVLDVLERGAPGSIVCLAGVSSGGHALPIDLGALNRDMVLENQVVFGSVNANRRHYQQAATALAAANPAWLARLITRRVPLDRWTDALTRRPDDVKPVIEFAT
ncbi:MAG: glucose 1-dehydrogenase [Candidatus Eisenbacteria bacterium]|nr:glucose 1-dehydrogenase [Candidatus Eisenbacteria bacterium]